MPQQPPQQGAVDGQQHKICSTCGQSYDAFDLEQHSHHTGAPHAPLPEPELPPA